MLVDTSVWVDHLRRSNGRLVDLLADGAVWTHPFIVGELACGNLAKRAQVLKLFTALPVVQVAGHEDVLAFVENHRLMGTGLGWIDVHLLVSAELASLPLWTADKRLSAVARDLGFARTP